MPARLCASAPSVRWTDARPSSPVVVVGWLTLPPPSALQAIATPGIGLPKASVTCTTSGCANGRSLFASSQRADGRSRAGAPTDNQRFLLPRTFVRVLRLRSRLDDGRGTGHLVATHSVFELYGMQPLLVANIDGMRVVGLLLGNEEMSRTAVRQRDGHKRALHGAIGRGDRVGVRARHSVLLLDLLGVHGPDVPCARRK